MILKQNACLWQELHCEIVLLDEPLRSIVRILADVVRNRSLATVVSTDREEVVPLLRRMM